MLTFAHADIRAPRSGAVMQVEFSDAGTVVSARNYGTTRFWDVATGAQKKEMPGEQFTFSKGISFFCAPVATSQKRGLLSLLAETTVTESLNSSCVTAPLRGARMSACANVSIEQRKSRRFLDEKSDWCRSLFFDRYNDRWERVKQRLVGVKLLRPLQ